MTDAQQAEPVAAKDSDDAVYARLLAEADGTPAQAAPAETPKADAPDLSAAIALAKRDNLSEAVVRAMSPADLQAYTQAAAKRQADVDGYAARLKAAEEAAKQAKQPEATAPAATPAAATGATAPAPTPEAALKAIQDARLAAELSVADAALRVQHGAKAPAFDAVKQRANEIGAANPGKYATVAELVAAAYSGLVQTGLPTPSAPSQGAQPSADPDAVAFQALAGGATVRDAAKAYELAARR